MKFSSTTWITLFCLTSALPSRAQDPALQAAQLQQQQIQQQQITQQQIDLINQQQLSQGVSTGLGGYRLGASTPRLTQQPGPQPGTVILSMDDRTRGTSIFYTLDGWTPTAASQRYLGPITITNT